MNIIRTSLFQAQVVYKLRNSNIDVLIEKERIHFSDFIFLAPGPPSACKRPMDIGVIMDRSGSVGAANFEKAKQFVISLVHKLQISSHGTRIGVIPYHSDAQVAVKFADVAHQSPDAMTRLIKGIPYTSGMTRTDKAIELASSHLFSGAGGLRSDKPNVLIVMTDGKTNAGSKPYKTVLAPLKVSHALSYSNHLRVFLGICRDLRQCSEIFWKVSGYFS